MAQVFTVRNDKGQDFQVDEHKIADAEKDGFLPVVSNGKAEHRVAYADLPLATKDGYQPVGSDKQGPLSNTQKPTNETQAPQEESMGRRLTRSTLDTVLPVGGALVAGTLATPESFGVATVPAGAAGYAAGKQLSRILKHYILGDDAGASGAEGLAKQTVGDLGEGALMETTGLATGKAIEAAAPYVAPIVKPVAEKIGNGVKAVGEKLAGTAERQAAKAVGAGAKEFEKPAVAQAIGRNALDEKIIGPFTGAEQSLSRATKAKEAAGKSMDDVYSKVDKAIGPSVNPLETAVRVETELAPTYRTPINKSEVGQLENTIESILARGNENIKLEEAQALKKEIDSVAFPKGKKPIDPTPKQQMAADASAIIRDQIDKAATKGAEALDSKELVQQLSDARKSYGVNRQTEKLLTREVGKEGVSVGSKIQWTADPIKFGSSILKKFGPNMKATNAIALDKVSTVLKKSPDALGKFGEILKQAEQGGPEHLATMHMILERTNPEYQQLLQKAAGPNDAPQKGPEKWANDGFEKLIEHSSELKDKRDIIFADPKLKELLIQASDLKPGTKAMEDIKTKIKSRVSKVQE